MYLLLRGGRDRCLVVSGAFVLYASAARCLPGAPVAGGSRWPGGPAQLCMHTCVRFDS